MLEVLYDTTVHITVPIGTTTPARIPRVEGDALQSFQTVPYSLLRLENIRYGRVQEVARGETSNEYRDVVDDHVSIDHFSLEHDVLSSRFSVR